ncbi:MAG: ribonuclease H-like YkuK family protein [Candidatus Doudnabacteria bacterium]|nr:ribonuclease H-like YkuK family protein [Candidatus Doudnabacteria bacterium]
MLKQEKILQQERQEGLFFNEFKSQTYGKLDFQNVIDKLLAYIEQEPGLEYEIIIGTDSMANSHAEAEFVSAIVVHRKSRGGIYFWSKRHEANLHTLRQRIFQEALFSLKLAEQLINECKQKNFNDFHLSIHVDIGPNGETKQMLHEIVGMIRGNGFEVKTKPDSYGASSVADRHT